MEEPRYITGPVEIKVTWGFVWAFFWRNLLLGLAFTAVIYFFIFLIFAACGLAMGNIFNP